MGSAYAAVPESPGAVGIFSHRNTTAQVCHFGRTNIRSVTHQESWALSFHLYLNLCPRLAISLGFHHLFENKTNNSNKKPIGSLEAFSRCFHLFICLVVWLVGLAWVWVFVCSVKNKEGWLGDGSVANSVCHKSMRAWLWILSTHIKKLFGYVWLYVAVCGYVWLCMAVCGCVWLCLVMRGYMWQCVAMCSYVWHMPLLAGQPS